MPFHATNKKLVYLPAKLEARIGELLEFPCTIVQTPPNFGKTTAIREILCRLSAREEGEAPVRALWNTMLQEDETFFWEDMGAALAQIFPDFAGIRLGYPEKGDGALKRRFLKAFSEFRQTGGQEIVLVIDTDEYGVSDASKDLFEFLIKNIPEHFHLVFCCRMPVLKKDSQLYLYGRIHHIGRDSFQFSTEDIEHYYRLSGVVFPKKSARALAGSSEGWIAPIRLNLVHYIDNGSFLSPQVIEKTVEKTFYLTLPRESRECLSWLCALERWTPEQAEYMCGPGVHEILRGLLARDLLVTFHEITGEYALDNIFAGCVIRHFRQLSHEERCRHYDRAGDCFREADQVRRSRQYYYKAQNHEMVMQMVERRLFVRPFPKDDYAFISYYTDCPPEIRARHPKAILIFAKHLYNSDRCGQSQQVLLEFQQAMQNNTADLGDRRRLEAMYELLLAYICYNDIAKMLTHLQNTEQLIGEDIGNEMLWFETGLNEMASVLNMYHRKPGELQKEVALFEDYNRRYARFSASRTAGAEIVMRAEAQYMTGDIPGAKITLYEAFVIAGRSKQWGVWLSALYLQIRVEMMAGNWVQVEDLLRETREDVTSDSYHLVLSATDICTAHVYCKLGQPDMLAGLFAPGWDEVLNHNFRVVPGIYAIHAEVLLARREYVPLLGLSKKYLDACRFYPNLMLEITLEIVLAAAHEALSEHGKAAGHLTRALELALPDGILMPFVEFAEHIAVRLGEISLPAYAEELRAMRERCAEFKGRLKIMRDALARELHYDLTPQERNVIRMLEEDYSNKEIAEALFISESTVKTHLSHAFGKLGIKKRGELKDYVRRKKRNNKQNL